MILIFGFGIFGTGIAQTFDTQVLKFKPTIQIPDHLAYKKLNTSYRSDSRNIFVISATKNVETDIAIYYSAEFKDLGDLLTSGRTIGSVELETETGAYMICALESGTQYLKIVMLHVYPDRIESYHIDRLARN